MMRERKDGFYKVHIDGEWAIAHCQGGELWSICGQDGIMSDDDFDIIVENPIEFRDVVPEYVVIDMMHSDDHLYFLGSAKFNSTSLVRDVKKAWKYSESDIESLRGVRANEKRLLALPFAKMMESFTPDVRFPIRAGTIQLAITKYNLEKYII